MEININGLNINYIDVGQGEPVLLLHGWGSNCDAFRFIINSFSDRFRMIALDFPGFGKSDVIDEPWDVSDYVDFTVKFIEKLGLRSPTLVGHSFGGRVIIKMVGSGLVEPSKIILMDSAGVKHKRSLASKIKLASFKTVKWFLLLPVIRNFSAKALDRARAFFGSADYNSAPAVMRTTLVKVVNEDLCSYMSGIKAPTLLIWGDKDEDTPLSDAKTMEKLIPDSGLCVIKGGGHFSFIDSPYEVNAIINSFLGGGNQ